MQICFFIHSGNWFSEIKKNLISHYDENDLSVRMHGNASKRPHNPTTTEEVE